MKKEITINELYKKLKDKTLPLNIDIEFSKTIYKVISLDKKMNDYWYGTIEVMYKDYRGTIHHTYFGSHPRERTEVYFTIPKLINRLPKWF